MTLYQKFIPPVWEEGEGTSNVNLSKYARLDGSNYSNSFLEIKDNEALKTDGSNQMSADLDVDTNKITNLAEPTATTDATNKEYVDTEIILSKRGKAYIPQLHSSNRNINGFYISASSNFNNNYYPHEVLNTNKRSSDSWASNGQLVNLWIKI